MVAKGVTPSSKSVDDLVAAINTLANKSRTETITITFGKPGGGDSWNQFVVQNKAYWINSTVSVTVTI